MRTGEIPRDLVEQRAAWEQRSVLRALYAAWARLIEAHMAPVDGPSVELGTGSGVLAELLPSLQATDVVATPWAREVVDAQCLPYEDSSIANLVMVDVLHHMPMPLRFLAEAQRALRPGGRVVMVEPFCSALSTPLYRTFHHERTDMSVDPFVEEPQSGDEPFDSNQALPTLIFWRGLHRYRDRFPKLPVVRRERFDWLVYPLSGGFTGRRLVPPRLYRLLRRLEHAGSALDTLAAFRCLVALEKARKD